MSTLGRRGEVPEHPGGCRGRFGVLATLPAMAVLPHEGTYPVLYGPFTVPVGSGYRRSYLARPDKAGRYPVVVVLHDLGGLDAHEKDICRRLARHGFAAICLELYEAPPAGTTVARWCLIELEANGGE